MSRLHVFFSLFAFILLLSTAAAQSPPQSITDVQITSISGCVDVYPVTVNCSVARNTLRIQTAAGFPVGRDLRNRPLNVNVQLGDFPYFTTTSVWPDLSDSTNSSVYVNVTARAYYPHLTGALISVSFVDNYSPDRPTSPPFAGFSYLFDGPPTLSTIGGCNGSGLATLDCVPDVAVVELTGSGLLWYSSGLGFTLTIGNASTVWALSSQILRVVNDSYAIMSLTLVYATLLKPQQYAGVLLPFSITSASYNFDGRVEYSYTTNALHISFVPLPPPVINRWFTAGCEESGKRNLATYTNCLPDIDLVYFSGHYIYDVQASIGGVPCPKYNINLSVYVCILPYFDFDPSVAYDLVAWNDAGNATLPGLIQYAQTPTLISIDQCIDRGDLYWIADIGVQCLAGTTITLRGSRFPVADAVSVQFVSYGVPNITIELLDPIVVNSTAIIATLPALDDATAAAVYGAYGSVQVMFSSSGANTTSNALANRLYLPPNAPSVTSVTSSTCDSVTALQLTSCRAMAVITVVGINLFTAWDLRDGLSLATSMDGVYQGSNYLLPSNASIELDPSTNTSFVFMLEYFDADTNVNLLPDVVYTIVISSDEGHFWTQSNAFRLSLTYGTAVVAGTSLSSGLSSGAIAGIVIAAAVVAALLAVIVLQLVRRHRSGASLGDNQYSLRRDAVQSGSGRYKDVELN